MVKKYKIVQWFIYPSRLKMKPNHAGEGELIKAKTKTTYLKFGLAKY